MITFKRANIRVTSDYDVSSQLAELAQIEVESQAYLSDLLLAGEGDIFLSRGDLKLAAGLLNFGQAITHRLMTTKGRHPLDPTLGVSWDKYLGASYSSSEIIITELSAEIQEEVYRDFRTGFVNYVNVSFEDENVIAVLVGITPLNEEEIIQLDLAVQG